MKEANKIASRYLRQNIFLTLGLYASLFFLSRLAVSLGIVDVTAAINIPLIVSALFSLLTSAAVGMLWQWVATAHEDMLTTFYTATSGFRMLLALLVLTVIYFIVGRQAMLPYVLVFMLFYFVTVGFHSFFFARLNNKK